MKKKKTHGGKRDNAGRPKAAVKRVNISTTVKPSTLLHIMTEKDGLSIGQYIDVMAEDRER